MQCAALQAERDELSRQLSEIERELEEFKIKYNHDISDYENELSAVLEQLRLLMDAKMSLELEISCYKKLLEGEETRYVACGCFICVCSSAPCHCHTIKLEFVCLRISNFRGVRVLQCPQSFHGKAVLYAHGCNLSMKKSLWDTMSTIFL